MVETFHHSESDPAHVYRQQSPDSHGPLLPACQSYFGNVPLDHQGGHLMVQLSDVAHDRGNCIWFYSAPRSLWI